MALVHRRYDTLGFDLGELLPGSDVVAFFGARISGDDGEVGVDVDEVRYKELVWTSQVGKGEC